MSKCCICKKRLWIHVYMDGSDIDGNNKYCKDCIGNLIWGKELNDLQKNRRI